MQPYRNPRMLVLPLAVMLLASPAMAFNSFPSGNLHRHLTEAAAQAFGLSPSGIRLMGDENYRQDFDEMTLNLLPGKALVIPNGRYNPADHFDRNAGEDSAIAFNRGVLKLHFYVARAVSSLQHGQWKAAYLWMGRASHGLQDFFSHSNYVDLSPAEQATCRNILAGRTPLTARPTELVMTGYDKTTGRDIPGDAYAHDAKSKDGPDKNDEARMHLGTQTKFQLAYDAALEATRAMIQGVRNQASLAQWSSLQHWN
jgi:hypothetical protein